VVLTNRDDPEPYQIARKIGEIAMRQTATN